MDSFDSGLFIGVHHRNLDDKGRLTVPAAWRPKKGSEASEGAKSGVFLAIPNPSGYITVYPPERVQDLKAKLGKIGLKDRGKRSSLTRFLSMLHEFEFDKQGRINLSAALMKHAGIEKEAVMLGELSSFAIYSPESYDREMDVSDEALDETFEEFEL
ncbi:MAG: division/cell wall cluster transcriptional repressor MraZ [Opitutales bacterium]